MGLAEKLALLLLAIGLSAAIYQSIQNDTFPQSVPWIVLIFPMFIWLKHKQTTLRS